MTRPTALAAAVLAAVLATGVCAGCGIRPTGIVVDGGKPMAGGEADDVTVYLVGRGRLRAITRPGMPGLPYLPISQLSVRPTVREREQGLRTDVPARLETARSEESRLLTVYTAPGGRSRVREWPSTAYGQIACTADAIPGIDRVVLVDSNGPDRVWLDCDDFADLLG